MTSNVTHLQTNNTITLEKLYSQYILTIHDDIKSKDLSSDAAQVCIGIMVSMVIAFRAQQKQSTVSELNALVEELTQNPNCLLDVLKKVLQLLDS